MRYQNTLLQLLAIRKITVLLCSVSIFGFSYCQPKITSFSPSSGPVGTTVTISGANFSSVPGNNVVYFGGVKASVLTSSPTSLSVAVPTSATYQPISVTVNGFSTYSSRPFIVTFGGGVITTNSFVFVDTLADRQNIETTDGLSADVDGDGKIDLAVVDRINNQLLIYRNRSTNGAFSFDPEKVYIAGSQPVSLATADIDGDGKLDIVTANKIDNTVSIFRNTSIPGLVSFAPKIDFATDNGPLDVALADFDGDGKPDIATVNSSIAPSYVDILRNLGTSGTISFAPKSRISLAYPATHLAIGDANGDSQPDIVTISIATNEVSVLTNTSAVGNFSFSTPINFATGNSPSDIAIGDLDGDAKPEIAVTDFFSNTVSIYRNTSSGTTTSFNPFSTYSVSGADHVSMFDANGDGKTDLIVETFSPSGFSVYKNISTSGSISLVWMGQYTTGCANGLVGADWNADGKTDLAITCDALRATFWNNKTTEPQITGFNPTSAAAGQTVTITGANFTGTTSVKFGGVAAASYTVVSPTSITAVVGTGASGSVEVTGPSGSSTRQGFSFIAPPVVSSFTPQSGTSGTTVTITGSNFIGVTAVSFGGVAASTFTIIDASTIRATIGSGASGNVAVTSPYGSGSLAGFTYNLPAATINTFTPTYGGTGAVISISGTNFTGATAVSFGGINATSFSVVNVNQITAVVANGASGDVKVTTPSGSATLSGFVYIPPPVISSIYPSSGKSGDTITINGTNLTSVTSVSFGGVPASAFNIVNATKITAIVGNGASGDIFIGSPYGNSKLSGFTYLPPPVIQSFSPTSGGIGTTVLITGSYFTGASKVYFNGQPAASFVVLSSTSISAVTGNGNTGSIEVITPNGFGLSSSYFTFVYPPPSITSFSPLSATTGMSVNITGTNFYAVSSVDFGGTPASSYVVNSPTSLTAVVGQGASGSITVKSLEGQSSMPGFTFIAPPPTVSAFYPSIGATGTSVAIKGTNFSNATSVTFGGVESSSFVVNSSTSITAIVGKGASGSVTVTSNAGSGTAQGQLFVFESPQISSFSPSSGASGSTITILGSGFINVSSVKFGGVQAASFQVVSSSMITAVLGSGGSGNVVVSTMRSTARAEGFTFISPGITISSVVPMIASSGSTIKIRGQKFSGTTAVMFGGIPATSFVVESDTLITAVVGTGASGAVSVSAPAGNASYPGFIFTTAPVITSVLPKAAPIGSSVTISGFNFSATPSDNIVYFGSVRAQILSSTASKLVVAVPLGATYEPVTITVNGLTVSSLQPFNVTFSSLGRISSSSFALKIDSSVTNNPSDISVADINQDGKNDLAITTEVSHSTVVFKNQSAPGKVDFSPKKLITDSHASTQSKFADLDGDGAQDLIVTNDADIYGVSIFRNISTKDTVMFATELLFNNLKLSNFFIDAGDFDGDGKIDLAVGSQYSYEVSVYKNTSRPGTISFAVPLRVSVPVMSEELKIADMDGDGKLDMIVTGLQVNGTADGAVYVYRNKSKADSLLFESPISFRSVGNAGSIAVADLDGDGKLDMVTANANAYTISIFRNVSRVGTIDFTDNREIISAASPHKIEVADLDGDGKPDVTTANDMQIGSLSLFRNISTADSILMDTRIDLVTGANAVAVGVADIDADGRPDLISANHAASSISVLRNLVDGYFIHSFSPATGTKGTSVTIKGTHFNQVTSVSFGGKSASSFTIDNDSTITAVVSDGDSGSVVVSYGSISAGLPGFTYTVPAPTITSFSPTTAATGATVAITGTNFIGVTSVSFGGVPAQSFIVNSSTSISAVIAGGASGNVTITTAGGTASLAGFTYTVATAVSNPIDVNSKELKINPNPGNGVIVISHPIASAKAKLSFVDLLGRAVKSVDVKQNSKQTETNVASLPPGIYQIIWNDRNRNLSKSFVLNHN